MNKIIQLLYRLVELIFLLIVPSLCANCKVFLSQRTIFCQDCSWRIFPIVSQQIDITPSVSVTVFAISDYKDPLKRLILAKRWSEPLASTQLGELLWTMTPISSLDYDIITPIP